MSPKSFLLRYVTPLSLIVFTLSTATTMASGNFEPEAPQFRASSILDQKALKGPHHSVRETVINRGYLNQYQLDTPFGEFQASGDQALYKLILELQAIAELQQMSKSEVAAKSAAEAVQKPIEAVKQIAENPVDTVKGIPKGVGRLFSRIKDVAEDVSEKVEQTSNEEGSEGTSVQAGDLAKSYFGVTSAQRKLANELGVDPYSRNQILQSELGGMAKYAAVGSFGAKLIPGIPGVGVITNVSDLVWKLSARDLKIRNEKSLQAMSIEETQIENFFSNPHYTPTDQTTIVAGLESLGKPAGLHIVIEKATAVRNVDEALFFVRWSVMLSAYHHSRAPIVGILDSGRLLPLAVTKDDLAVLAVPVDYVNWQPNSAEAMDAFAQSARQGEVWVEGRISDRARQELKNRGWSAFDQAFSRLVDPN